MRTQDNRFEIQVRVKGKPTHEFGSNGRTFIEGRKGSEFTLYFKNNTASRVMAVASIDGLSVIDGKPCGPNSDGYVVAAYSALDISGWRTSLSEVAKFVFASKGNSYAGKTEGESNCGVIGLRVFSEKEKPYIPPPSPIVIEHHHHHNHYPTVLPPWRPVWDPFSTWCSGRDIDCTCSDAPHGILRVAGTSLSSSVTQCSASMASSSESDPAFNLGTAFGASARDACVQVSFDTGVLLSEMLIYYSDRSGLKKAGIDCSKAPGIPLRPMAFTGFCQPPK